MAFSWLSPGRTEEAACNEAAYLVAEGGIRRVTRGQLGRNNESFLFLSVSVSTSPPPLPLFSPHPPVSCEDGGSSGNFLGKGIPREAARNPKVALRERKRARDLSIFSKYAQIRIGHICCSSLGQQVN